MNPNGPEGDWKMLLSFTSLIGHFHITKDKKYLVYS